MASTLEQTKSQKPADSSRRYVEFDEYIDFQVNKTRAGIKHTDLLTAGVTIAVAVLGYLLAFVVLDQWVIAGGFGYGARLAMLGAVLAFVVGWTAWKIVVPYLKRVNSLYAAREIEQTQPDLKSSLLTLVDLKRAGRPVSPAILSAMEKRAALNLSQMDVEQAVDRRHLMRLSYALLAVVVLMCLYTVFSPKRISTSILRALWPASSASVATRTRIDRVDPGNATVLARSQLEVTVDLVGEIPPEVQLLFTTTDRRFVDEPLALRDTGEGLNRFRGTLAGPNGRGLLQDFAYHIVAGDATSDRYTVTVKQAPTATVEEIFLDYPDYMGLDDKTQPGGAIDAWEGTKVTVRAVTNMPVVAADVLFSETEDTSVKGNQFIAKVIDETRVEATWRLELDSDGTHAHFYRLQVRTKEGELDPLPTLHAYKVRRDLPPQLRLIHPTGDIELPANAVLPIVYEAADPDFLLRKVSLHFEKSGEELRDLARPLYEGTPPRSRLQSSHDLALAPFRLKAGDQLTWWLEAWDNMEPLGDRTGNRTVTPKMNITIIDPVSQDQVQEQLEEQRQQAQQRVDEAREQQERAAGQDGATEPMDGQREEGTEGTAERPGETGDPGEARQPGEQRTPQNDRTQSRPGDGERQSQPAEQTTDQPTRPGETPQEGAGGNSAQSKPQDGAGRQQTGDPQPGARTGQQQPGDQSGQQQPGSQQRPGERGQNGSGEPRDEAADDDALRRLFDKYKDQIEQQRQQDQQRPDDKGSPRERGSQDPAQDRNTPTDDGKGTEPQPGQEPGDEPATSPKGRGPEQKPAGTDDSGQQGPGETSSGGKPQEKTTLPPGLGQEKPRDGQKSGGDPGDGPPDSSSQSKPGDGTPSDNGKGPMKPGDVSPDKAQERRPGAGNSESPNRTSNDPGNPEPGDRNTTSPMPSESRRGDPATKPGDAAGGTKPGAKPQDSSGNTNPGAAEPAPRTRPGEQGSTPGEPRGSQGESGAERPAARTDRQPGGPEDPMPAEGRAEGQRSEQPSAGEKGSSQQTSEGTKGGTEQGPGDATTKPGAQSTGRGEKGGKPGDMPGEGSTTQPGGENGGGEKSGGEKGGGEKGGGEQGGGEKGGGDKGGGEKGGGEKGGGEGAGEKGGGEKGGGAKGGGPDPGGEKGGGKGEAPGGAGEKPAEGGSQPGEGRGQPGAKPAGSAKSGGGGWEQGANAPTGGSGSAANTAGGADAPNLNDRKRATNLVLDRLRDEMERGETPRELLEDLGWTEDKLRDFMQRLEQRLADTGADQSPEAKSRRQQFEAILRGIDYKSQGEQRGGGEGPRESAQGFSAPRRPAPAEFRADEEAYKKRISRQVRGPAESKAAP